MKLVGRITTAALRIYDIGVVNGGRGYNDVSWEGFEGVEIIDNDTVVQWNANGVLEGIY